MSKELPYFKFYVNEWITGDISLEDYDVQGLFTNLCAYYWSKECNITLSNAKRKFKDCKPTAFDSLISAKIIKVDSNDNLKINFLLEQLDSRFGISKTNSKNGKLGGRPKKETDPVAEKETTPGTTKKPNQTTHELFAERIMLPENELEKEAIELLCKKRLTTHILKEFNANCTKQSKKHLHFNEWKKHLGNWFAKQKEEVITKKYQRL